MIVTMDNKGSHTIIHRQQEHAQFIMKVSNNNNPNDKSKTLAVTMIITFLPFFFQLISSLH